MASIWYAHFDSTPEDKRLLLAEDWARYNRSLFTDGIKNGGDCFEVTAGEALSVKVNGGIAVVQGYILRVDEDESGNTVPLVLPAAHQTYNRIDRIVLRLDRRIERREISIAVLMGEAASVPSPPALTRNANIWELSVARVSVAKGQAYVLQSDITDERFDTDMCGIINSLIKLDPSSWQTQVDTNINAQIQKWNSALNSRIQELESKSQQYSTQFTAWFDGVRQDLAAAAVYNFDNLAAKAGAELTTVFSENSVSSVIRTTAGNVKMAEQTVTFEEDGSITSVEAVYAANGTTELRRSSVKTIFNADGTITEVIQ